MEVGSADSWGQATFGILLLRWNLFNHPQTLCGVIQLQVNVGDAEIARDEMKEVFVEGKLDSLKLKC